MKMIELFKNYYKHTPSYHYIVNKYLNNKYITIDHVAHRSLYSKPLIHFYSENGYQLMSDVYHFKDMNVRANWMYNKNANIKRIFISEYLGDIRGQKIDNPDDYFLTKNKSEYLAWTLLHRHAINHLAISVNNIENFYNTLSNDTNIKIACNIQSNNNGSLKQFSTFADNIEYKYNNGETGLVSGYFVEFIERNNYDGFNIKNATKIFNSTNT